LSQTQVAGISFPIEVPQIQPDGWPLFAYPSIKGDFKASER